MPSLDRLPIHESPRKLYPNTDTYFRTARDSWEVCAIRWYPRDDGSYLCDIHHVRPGKPIIVNCPTVDDLDALLISIVEDGEG